MEEVAFIFPRYLEPIIEKVMRRDWLVHNFILEENDDLYNPCNFLYNKHQNDVKYTIFLDLNIYQFLLNAAKKNFVKDDYKDAVSLLIFCQIANIEIDPMFAVYEKINYTSENLNEITKDLELFRNVNNADATELASYAMGQSSSFEYPNNCKIDHSNMQEKLTRYRRLKEWDSLYLMILVVTDINLDSAKAGEVKLREFVQWLIREFRLSLVAIVYALVLFSKKPIKRMMKYQISATKEVKKKCLTNMTWDLYMLNQFFREWTRKNDLQEHLFASDDKAFCKILRLAIEAQKKGNFSHFHEYISISTIEYLNHMDDGRGKPLSRTYKSEQWSPEYRSELIEKYEKALLK